MDESCNSKNALETAQTSLDKPERVFRSFSDSKIGSPSCFERWNGSDKGLITCWEVGRKKRESDFSLVEKVENKELPILAWKGGVDKKLVNPHKFGSLNYLAQWQGIGGQDLDISLTEEVVLECALTRMKVTFTPDITKYSQKES